LLRFLDQAAAGLAQRSSILDHVPAQGSREPTSAVPASTEAPQVPESQAAPTAHTRALDRAATPPA
jgi:hypothetical protein